MDYQKTSIVGIDSLQLLASQKTYQVLLKRLQKQRHSLAIMQDIQKQQAQNLTLW